MISFAHAWNLKAKLKLTPVEVAVLVFILDSEEGVSDAELLERAGLSSVNSLNVQISRLNDKLPATVRVLAITDDGGRRIGSQRVARRQISSDWAREHLMRLACGDEALPAQEQGRARA